MNTENMKQKDATCNSTEAVQVDLQKTLSNIQMRQTTLPAVEEKLQDLLSQLQDGSDPEVVLKKLVREEVGKEHEASLWKKVAFSGGCISLLLLTSIFGLIILSIQLSKDLFVETSQDSPALMDGEGQAVATGKAVHTYGLVNAPALPSKMLNSVTEITFNLQNAPAETVSVDITARFKFKEGFLFLSPASTLLYVTRTGESYSVTIVLGTPKMSVDKLPFDVSQIIMAHYPNHASLEVNKICGDIKCARFTARDPTNEQLSESMTQTRRLLEEQDVNDESVDHVLEAAESDMLDVPETSHWSAPSAGRRLARDWNDC